MTRRALMVLGMLASVAFAGRAAAQTSPAEPPYRNASLGAGQRAGDLVSRMTLEEKVSQMMNAAPAIPRLRVPEYDWWNEALHGVALRTTAAWSSSRESSG